MEKVIDHGFNIKRIREFKLMSQEALALMMGKEWTQKKISQLEAKAVIPSDIIEEVAKGLSIPTKAITAMGKEDEMPWMVYNNQFYEFKDQAVGVQLQYFPNITINHVDDWKQTLLQLQEVNAKKEALMETLISQMRVQIELLTKKNEEKK